jgi:IPT/TIG domain
VFKRNAVIAGNAHAKRASAMGISLSATALLVGILASIALLLGFAGAAFGASLQTSELAGPLGAVAQPPLAKPALTVFPNVSSPPTVTGVEPAVGSTLGGTTVTIEGSGFVAGATVTIGSKATSVEVKSETEIKATTAATAAGAHEVVVADEKGTSVEGASFTYIAPPKVTSITPVEGPAAGGTTVKIKGTGFREGSTVKIGGSAKSVTDVSETEITAKTAAGSAGKDEVVVTDNYGASTAGPSFSYIAPPKVSSVSPVEGSTVGGTAIKVKGSGFLKGSTVAVGGAATSVVVVSETEITAKTPATSAGKHEVVVTDVGGASTGGPEFTYVTPPKVSSVLPVEGPTAGGTAVVIKGSGFLEGSSVTIGKAAVEVEVVSETEITAKTAAGVAGKDEVVVGYASGVVSTGGPSFSYVAAPKVSSVSPSEGTTAGGTSVKIKGSGFLKGSTVAVGGAATGVVVVSETEITAKTPATSAGKHEVVVTDGGGASSAGPEFTFVAPPTVTTVEPSSGSTAGGTSVVIKGTGFLAGSTVTIGAKATAVEIVSEKEIKAKTAAGVAGKDEVVVGYASGVVSSSGPLFTYIAPPTVSSVTPAEGSTAGGTSVKIKGTGFVAGAKVKIGEEATGVVIVSETEITAKTAATAAGKDEVVIEDEKGSSVAGPSFSYIAPPKVTSITPAEGTRAGGTSVTIKGTGFLKGSTVAIGGTATSVVVVSETEITAKTPASTPGTVEVVVTDTGGGSSTEGPTYKFV